MKKWIVDNNGKKLYVANTTDSKPAQPEPKVIDSGTVELEPVSKSLDKLDDSQD